MRDHKIRVAVIIEVRDQQPASDVVTGKIAAGLSTADIRTSSAPVVPQPRRLGVGRVASDFVQVVVGVSVRHDHVGPAVKVEVHQRRFEAQHPDGYPFVYLSDEWYYLTGREFQLLRYFIERPGTTIPRKELLQAVWGYVADSLTRTVDAHVASLRQKLEENPKRPELILTVSGTGYKFVGQIRA